MNSCTYYRASAAAPFTAGVSKPLIDGVTLLPIVIPEGAFISGAWIRRDADLVGSGAFSVGWTGALDRIVPAVSVSSLVAGNVSYYSSGLQLSPTSDVDLLVTSSDDVTAGSVDVLVRCATYAQ